MVISHWSLINSHGQRFDDALRGHFIRCHPRCSAVICYLIRQRHPSFRTCKGKNALFSSTQFTKTINFNLKTINFYFTPIHQNQTLKKNCQFLHFFDFKNQKFHPKFQKFSQSPVFTSCHHLKILLYFNLSKFSSIL